jgi:hypothetical protein
MKKLFPYQKTLLNLNIPLEEYNQVKKNLELKRIDLSHVWGKGFRLFQWITESESNFRVCWLNDCTLVEAIKNTDKFLNSLEWSK